MNRNDSPKMVARTVQLLGMLICVAFLFTSTSLAQSLVGVDNRSVNRVERTKILDISNQIDKRVSQTLAEQNQLLNPLASDEVFVRRIYLDIVGRIPTLDEITRFLESESSNKRADLIDELLDSWGYVSHHYNYFADLLRARSRLQNNIAGQPYIDFIKDSLEANQPYDQFVHALIASEGPLLERGNGATGYYLRDFGMPEDNMSNTVRVFLGTRLECAQCHDHPYDKWTQRQYFEMVAFTGGMSYRDPMGDANSMDVARLVRDQTLSNDERRILRQVIQPIFNGVSGSGTGLARLPEGFQGSDGKAFEIVKAKTIFGEQPELDPRIPRSGRNLGNRQRQQMVRRPQQIPGAREIGSRRIFADWLIDADNPRFAKVIANRMWKQAMGLGLIEPVDVIDDSTVASNEALLDMLTQSMIELDFDLKQYLRAIYNSRTYQGVAVTHDILDPAEFYFNGPVMRRMTAEQIWDSLLTLVYPETDQRASTTGLGRQFRRLGIDAVDAYDAYDQLKEMSAEEILDLTKSIASGQRQPQMTMNRDRRSRNQNPFVRSSELPSPAPPGHFLREFGQSDREEIENANSEPSVIQVLSLMNGFVEQQLTQNRNAVLLKHTQQASSHSVRIEKTFLAMLSRYPTKSEQETWLLEFKSSPRDAEADLIWTLANSAEFIFVK